MFKNMSGNYDKEVTDGMLELDENTRTRGQFRTLKSNNVEFVWYCGSHFENGDR
jgi:hypothetical protein